MRSESLHAAMQELHVVGIRNYKVVGGGKHVKLMWWCRGEPRIVTLAGNTVEDCREAIRRIVQADDKGGSLVGS